MVLIFFDPTRTAATHQPLNAHLVDPEDADELAQVIYPLPDDKHAINRILGTMGSAKGVMAFAQSVAHSSTGTGAFHVVTTTKKRTVLFRPRDETYLLAVFPADKDTPDKDTPDAVLKDTVRAAWDTATLLFGSEPWLGDASEWWARWEAHILDNGPNGRGLSAWISSAELSDAEKREYADATDEVAGHFTTLRERVSSSTGREAASCYAINFTANSANILTKTTIYQNPPFSIYPTLTHHLLDLIHSSQPPTPSLTATRECTRSSKPTYVADKPTHHASKWTTLSLGTGGIPFLPSAFRQSSHSTPQTESKAKGNSITSWLSFGSSAVSPPKDPPTNTSNDNRVPRISTLDAPALNEALVTPQAIDVRWHVQPVFLPTVPNALDAPSDDEERPEKALQRYTLAYTIHTRTLVAVILNPSDRSTEDFTDRLNAPTDSQADIQSALSELVRSLQMPAEPASAFPTTSSHPDTPAIQYIHHTHNPHDRLVSNWTGHEIVCPASRKDHPSASAKTRPRRDITMDHLGTSARQSLISIDDAREIFARTANDVWLVGRRVSEGSTDSKDGDGVTEAYMVISAKETSIVDAEYQLRRILKNAQG